MIEPDAVNFLVSSQSCRNPECAGQDLEKERDGIICTCCGTVQTEQAHHFVDPVEAFIPSSNGSSQVLLNDNILSQSSLPRSVKYSQASTGSQRKEDPTITSGFSVGTIAQKESHRVLLYLTRRIGMSQMEQDETLRKFTYIMKSPKYFRSPASKRRTLAAVATYLTTLESDVKVTIGSLVGLLNNSHQTYRSDFHTTYNSVLLEMPELKPARKMNFPDLIDATTKLIQFTNNTERERVNELVNRLMPFDWRHNGTDSYAPVHGIVASAYLAWKSLNPQARQRVNFSSFCDRMKMPCWTMTSKRLVRLSKALIKIGQSADSIPCRKVTKKNLHYFLEGILMYDENEKWNLLDASIALDDSTDAADFSFSEVWIAEDKMARDAQRGEDSDDIDDEEIDSYLCDDNELKRREQLWDENQSI